MSVSTSTAAAPLNSSAAKYNDLPVKLMIFPAMIFMIMGMTIGVFMAYNTFLYPDYFSGEYIHLEEFVRSMWAASPFFGSIL